MTVEEQTNSIIQIAIIICAVFIILLLVLIIYTFHKNKKTQEIYLKQLAEQANKMEMVEELDDTRLQNQNSQL